MDRKSNPIIDNTAMKQSEYRGSPLKSEAQTNIKSVSGYSIFLDKELGKGAFSIVYLGEKQNTKERVAVKVISN